jgi:DNA-binding phage protein
MAAKPKTGFDRYFEQRMTEPEFAKSYESARAEIDAIDTLIRALDAARAVRGISKTELARRIGARPEIVRRLLTEKSPNPTWSTVLKLVQELDFHFELVPNSTQPTRTKHEPRTARI